MANEHLPLDMMQHEIKPFAVMKNSDADELSCEHGSGAEEREMSGKPLLTVDKNFICSKNDICTNEQLEILKSLEEVSTGKPPDQIFFTTSGQDIQRELPI